LRISDEPDPAVFKQVADILGREFHGEWRERLCGLDQWYWDLHVGDTLITLHREHYLGIMLFAAEANQQQEVVPEILVRAKEILFNYVPSA